MISSRRVIAVLLLAVLATACGEGDTVSTTTAEPSTAAETIDPTAGVDDTEAAATEQAAAADEAEPEGATAEDAEDATEEAIDDATDDAEDATEDAGLDEEGAYGDEYEGTDEGYVYDDPTQYEVLDYLTPEPGGVAEARGGSIVRGTQDAYVVDATVCCTGETLYVDVSAIEDNASFFVYGPDGQELATDTMSTVIPLEQTGEYWVVVGASTGNATYDIQIGIAVDAS